MHDISTAARPLDYISMLMFLTLEADTSVPSLAPSSHDAKFVDELERNGDEGIRTYVHGGGETEREHQHISRLCVSMT